MKHDKVIRSASIVGAFTMLSRVLGLGRDILMAGFFGTSFLMSAFAIAFTIPNLFRRLFGEGALSAAFIPVFIETRHEKGDTAAWLLARKIITLATITLILLVILGELAIPWITQAFNLNDEWRLIFGLLRIMLPYMVFICLAALSMALLNSYQHFAIPAATPCLLNITWISVLLITVSTGYFKGKEIYIVAYGVLLAGILQLGFQLPILYRFGFRPGFAFDIKDKKVNRVLTLMGPAAMGLALTQVNVLIDRTLAGLIGKWAAAALYYSERLIYLPLGLFATALSTVLLPTLSAHAASNNIDQLTQTTSRSLRNLLFIMVPAAIGLFVLAEPTIEAIYKWRSFDKQSVWYTTLALKCYAPGLIVFSLAKVFVPAFYSMQDTRTPFRIGVITVCINLIVNITFIMILPVNYKHAGIALATVMAEAFYAVTLFFILQKRIGKLSLDTIGKSLFKTIIAGIIMAIAIQYVLVITKKYLGNLDIPQKLNQIIILSGTIFSGITTYVGISFCIKSKELADIIISFKIRKKNKSL